MIWLVGVNGMLGREIAEKLSSEKMQFISSDIDVDITDKRALDAFVEDKNIDWIINASAYTAVDKAEAEEELAEKINAFGVGNLAAVARDKGAKIVHFSTDYVYNGEGTSFHKETDSVEPVSAYGRTKLNGEIAVQERLSKYFIFRISWLYGVYGNNFVKTMVKLFNDRPELNIINDQIGAPTNASGLAYNSSFAP
jgi:dTDP-4-dehydrorhamnose reductase